jgi:hypothetical protein
MMMFEEISLEEQEKDLEADSCLDEADSSRSVPWPAVEESEDLETQ